MSKKNSLAVFLLVVGIFFGLYSSTNAQQNPTKTARLTTLQNYLRASSIGLDERQALFSQFSAKDKSDLVRFHLALQIVKYPNLNGEQKQLILDSVSMLSPESYLEKNRGIAQQQSLGIQQRAMKLFSREMGSQIFANFSGTGEDLEILNKYFSVASVSNTEDRAIALGKFAPQDIYLFYKIQMAFGLVLNPNLSQEQRNLILEGLNQTNPEMYVNRNSPESLAKRNALLPLIEKVKKTFSSEVGGTTFAMIGDIEIEIEEPGAAPRCHCLLDSWFSGCSVSSTCKGGSDVCNDSPNNGTHCGFLGLWACNGRCS